MIKQASCYYIHRNRFTDYITFVRFDEFVYVYVHTNKPVIIYLEDIFNDPKLYNYYLLSLLLTEDPNKLVKDNNRWNISAYKDWKRMYISEKYECLFEFKRNIFNKQKPKRISSDKKIRKLYNRLDKFYEDNDKNNNYYFPYIPELENIFDDYLYKQIIYELDDIEYSIILQEEELKKYTLLYSSNILPIELVRKIMSY